MPLGLPVALGCAVGSAWLALWPEAGAWNGLATGIKAALAALVARLAWRLLAPPETPGTPAGTPAVPQPPTSTAGVPAATLRLLDTPAAPLAVAGVVSLVLAAVLWRAPGRATLNVVGYLSLALPLAWVVWRARGPLAGALAVAALGVLALGATGVDVRRPPLIQDVAPDSAHKWAAGWPLPGWALRHELRFERPLEARPVTLAVPLAGRYEGPARVHVRLNGADLGAATNEGGTRLLSVAPAALVAGQTRLVWELRQEPQDPRMRVLAFRVARGATVPEGPSAYYDPRAGEWRTGTFNDAAGRHQPGTYVLRLEL
jgi:hypothetical protein